MLVLLKLVIPMLSCPSFSLIFTQSGVQIGLKVSLDLLSREIVEIIHSHSIKISQK